jgi:hypothetical protein
MAIDPVDPVRRDAPLRGTWRVDRTSLLMDALAQRGGGKRNIGRNPEPLRHAQCAIEI